MRVRILGLFAIVVAALIHASGVCSADVLTAYQQECQKAGVPLPPTFAGATKWKFLGTIPSSIVFASGLPTTDIWRYAEAARPAGICVALPRKKADGTIDLMGVICQASNEAQVGTETKPAVHACFWDNLKPDGMTRITDKDITKLNPFNFLGGDKIPENCTNCHRGDNAYIVIPKTFESDADAGHVLRNGTPYVPIGQANWNNPLGTVALVGGCDNCHSIPGLAGRDPGDPATVKSRYCAVVLANFINGRYPVGHPDAGKLLMPPGKAGLSAAQKADIKSLNDACTALNGVGFGGVAPPVAGE